MARSLGFRRGDDGQAAAQIPVRLLYQTILFSDDGEPIIRNDPYGWNDRLALALGFTASNAMMMKREKGDVGP